MPMSVFVKKYRRGDDMSGADKEIAAGERKLADMDFKAALSKFKRAIKLDPKAPEAHFGKAEAALGVPKIPAEEVLADYQEAIALDPSNPFYLARLGSFSLEAGEWELAEEAYNRAAEADPDNAYLYYSEFGLEYYYSWLAKHGEDADQADIEPVQRKCLVYLVRSLDLDEAAAKRLLG
jgi:tetratricopeptide (TPR) repeat protein